MNESNKKAQESSLKLSSNIARSTLFSALIAGSSALGLTSCADLFENKQPLSEAESCTRLKGLIASHQEQFKPYKKSLSRARNLNVWSTDPVFPSAENCAIWEWSSGLYTYLCDWVAEDGRGSAQADYAEGQRIIKNCLGNDWRASDSQTTQSGGEHIFYQKPGVDTIISLRYFKEPRSWIETWHTVVAIGDKNNLNAKLQ